MKLLSYILSIIFAFLFWLILVVFHIFQVVSLKLFGYTAHKNVVDYMNLILTKIMLVLGIRTYLDNSYTLPTNQSIIFVCNHQSLFDIAPLSWYFRKHHPKFVSKKELGKGIPSVSYNLRNGGAVMIDRNNPKQAITAMIEFAKYLKEENHSAIIFPEGTRSKDGTPKPFVSSGLKILTKFNPTALVVPVTINNSWKAFKYGKFPLGLFAPITITVHQPIAVNSMPFAELFEKTESIIKQHITNQ